MGLTLEDLLVANLALRRSVIDVESLRGCLMALDKSPQQVPLARALVDRHGVRVEDARALHEGARGKLRQRYEERYVAVVRQLGAVPAHALDPLAAEALARGASVSERLLGGGLLSPPQHEAIAQQTTRALAEDEARLLEQNRQQAFAPALGAARPPPASAPHRVAPGAASPSSPDARLWASQADARVWVPPPEPGRPLRATGGSIPIQAMPAMPGDPRASTGARRAPAPPPEDAPVDGGMTLKLPANVASGVAEVQGDLAGERTMMVPPPPGAKGGPPPSATPPQGVDAERTLTLPAGGLQQAMAQDPSAHDTLPPGAIPPGAFKAPGPASSGAFTPSGPAADDTSPTTAYNPAARATGARPAAGAQAAGGPASAFAGRRVAQGRYEIVRELGRGNMGIVFLAAEVASGRQVALKVVQSAGNAEARARFRREILVSKRIKHEHVIEVTDAGDLENGAPYMAMEVLTGTSLTKSLKASGPLPNERALRIFKQMLVGLEAVHQANVVHRDLKPDNIQLLERDDGHVKIVDFGVSRFTDQGNQGEEEGQVFMTVRGTLSGTPQYVAPEAVLDPDLVSTTHDVYACGVILFELLTGVLPFAEKRSLKDILADTLNTRPRNLDDANPGGAPYPPPLERFVRRLLEKDAEARPKDATAALAALKELEAELTGGGAEAAEKGARKTGKQKRRLGEEPESEGFTSRLMKSITGLFKRGP